MRDYYLNLLADAEGFHLVHTENCKQFPDPDDALALGFYALPSHALIEARKIFPQCKVCELCIQESAAAGSSA